MKLLKISLSVYFFTSFAVATTQPPEQLTPQQACESAVMKVEESSVGMDMASYAMVQQTVSSVSQSGNKKSIKKAHQGSALINSTLSVVALKRCSACEKAIKGCKQTCSAKNCDRYKMPQAVFNTDYNVCVRELNSQKRECFKHKSECQNSCLQAMLSGAQALGNINAARALSDCSGPNCNQVKNDPKNKPVIHAPDGVKISEIPGIGSKPPDELGAQDPDPFGMQFPPAGENQQAQNNLQEDSDQKNKAGGVETKTAGSGSPPTDFSYEDNYEDNYGGRGLANQQNSGSAGRGKQAGKEKDKNSPKYSKNNFETNEAGLSGYTGYETNNSDTALGGGGGKAPAKKDKSIKMASADKKNLGIGKAKDNIFVQMSRFITKVCDTDKKCYHKKQ